MTIKTILIAVTLTVMTSYVAHASQNDDSEKPCDVIKRATCDAWFYDFKRVKGGVDYCSRISDKKRGKYTVPEGTTGFFGDPANYGWDLRIDYEPSGRDVWCK